MEGLLTLDGGIVTGHGFRKGGVYAFLSSGLIPPVDECVEIVVLVTPGMRILCQRGSYFEVLISKGLQKDLIGRSV